MIDIEKIEQAFDEWFDPNDGQNYWDCWLAGVMFAEAYAAKVLEDKEREIAELKKDLILVDTLYRQSCSSINDLCETLEEITNTDPDEGTQWFHSKAEQALAITPAQSLIEHDNEVIERCAKAAEKNGNGITANKIRTLKEKQ